MASKNRTRLRAVKLINALIGQVRASEGRNITGKEIAARIGVQAATVSRWVNGKTSLDQIEYLLTLLENVPQDRWQNELTSALSSKSRKM